MGNMKIQKIDDFRWRIPREGRMRTHGVVYADEKMMASIRGDQSLSQVANVAWPPLAQKQELFLLAGSATTSIEGSDSCAQV